MRIFVSVKISKMEEEKKLVPFRLCTLLDEYSWGSEEWHLADLGWRDTAVRDGIAVALDALPPHLQEEPLSQLKNNDTPYIDTARDVINANIPERLRAEAAAVAARQRDPSPELAAIQGANARQAQKVRTLYGQMMMPVALRQILPTGVIGLFALLMLMLLISTDDSRIFNASSTWVQDVVLPFLKKAPTSKQHISMLRWSSVAVALFFFVVAVFFSQLDYINMFTQIMCAVWLGGGGTIMVFGLYTRFGNTVGAWCSIVFGCGFSLLGLILQRTWAASVVPVLASHGWTEGVFRFFAKLAEPLNPWVDWSFGFNSGESTLEQALQLFREKFFMNSTEIYGISMVLSVAAYCLGSWIALKCGWCQMFNLDMPQRPNQVDTPEDMEVTDISVIENVIYIEPTEVRTGNEAELSVKMKNAVKAEGFGFDLYLPDGLTFKTDVDGFPEAYLSTLRTTARKTNTFESVIRPDGALRVMAASTNGSIISGNDGEVATVKILVDSDVTPGVLPIILRQIAISDSDARSYDFDEVKSYVTVLDGTLDIQSVYTSRQTRPADNHIYNLQGQRVSSPSAPGIYVKNGRKFVVR